MSKKVAPLGPAQEKERTEGRRSCRLQFVVAGFVGIVVLAAAPQAAWPEHLKEQASDAANGAAVQFDFDDPPDTRHHLTDHLTFGVNIKAVFEYERNFNLDEGRNDDLALLGPELEAAFSYDPVPWFRGFLDFELNKRFEIEAPADRRSEDPELILRQAFVNFREVIEGISLTLGRQRFEDEREWLYDEELDAARLFFRHSAFGLEASVSREELIEKNLIHDSSIREINNYLLLGHYALGEESDLSPYVFYRDDRTGRDEDLLFLGLRSYGELMPDLDYWAEFAHVRGSEGSADIRGYGVDLGATYAFDVAFEPSLTLGAAFGTGDGDPNDGTDRSFRQTGLQENTAEFNGVTSFAYYGEVLDPELSNLFVLTAGLGVRPSEGSSLDLVYHHYRQHEASDELRNSALDADPNGRNRTIGNGLDLIFGFREIEDVDFEAIFGVFAPGSAFSNDADPAYFAGIELEFSF